MRRMATVWKPGAERPVEEFTSLTTVGHRQQLISLATHQRLIIGAPSTGDVGGGGGWPAWPEAQGTQHPRIDGDFRQRRCI